MNLFMSFICLLSISDLSLSPAIVSISYDDTNVCSTYSTNENPFRCIGSYPAPYKVLDCDDGYAYYDLEIYKASYTSNSNLFLIHCETVFTPGYVARINNETQSNGNNYKEYMLKRGYVHLGLKRYNENNKLGGTIAPKLMWPSSSSVTTTFTSTYGVSSTIGGSFGRGIELGNGGSIAATANASNSSSLTFTYNQSLSSVVSDPVLSNQFSSSDYMEAQWSFEVLNKDVAGKLSYHLDTYYLFEMSKNTTNCGENAFTLDYSVMYQGQYIGFLWITYEGWQFDSSVHVSCFAD